MRSRSTSVSVLCPEQLVVKLSIDHSMQSGCICFFAKVSNWPTIDSLICSINIILVRAPPYSRVYNYICYIIEAFSRRPAPWPRLKCACDRVIVEQVQRRVTPLPYRVCSIRANCRMYRCSDSLYRTCRFDAFLILVSVVALNVFDTFNILRF